MNYLSDASHSQQKNRYSTKSLNADLSVRNDTLQNNTQQSFENVLIKPNVLDLSMLPDKLMEIQTQERNANNRTSSKTQVYDLPSTERNSSHVVNISSRYSNSLSKKLKKPTQQKNVDSELLTQGELIR